MEETRPLQRDPRPTALVLCGGGSRGAIEVGYRAALLHYHGQVAIHAVRPQLDREVDLLDFRHTEMLIEAAYRQTRAQLVRALFDACYDGIFLVDVDSQRIIEANEPGLRLLGYTREEVRRLTVTDVLPYAQPDFLETGCNLKGSGRRQSHELTCRTKNGELIPAQLLASALTSDGRPCVQLMVHDLREHRLAQLGLAVSKIAHDLRGILATAQLVADNVAASRDPECQRITPRLIAAIDRAIRLCTDTLTYGRATPPPPCLMAVSVFRVDWRASV